MLANELTGYNENGYTARQNENQNDHISQHLHKTYKHDWLQKFVGHTYR